MTSISTPARMRDWDGAPDPTGVSKPDLLHSMPTVTTSIPTSTPERRAVDIRIAGESGLPRVLNNRFIDIQASKEEIDRRLDELVKIATTSGFAVGIGQPYPATVERVAAFVRGAEARGLAIAPISAIADHQKE